MDEMAAARTPHIIASEINLIKHQTGKMLLISIIEIGKRLSEAKGMFPHGEWGRWLEEAVNYTQRTAENYMKIADAYGAYLTEPAPARELPNISFSQALVLLGIPEEERAQFIVDMDIESMTTRELRKVVEEREQTRQELERAGQNNVQIRQALEGEKEESGTLKKELDDLKRKVDSLTKAKQELEQNIAKKDQQMEKMKGDTLYKNYQLASKLLDDAQVKLSTAKVAFSYEALEKKYRELTYELKLLAGIDIEMHGKYKDKLKKFLLKALDEG